MFRTVGFCLLAWFLFPASVYADENRGAAQKADLPPAMRLLMPLAAQGNATAQNDLGVMYDTGNGVPQDYAEAVKWFRKSAEQGNPVAQYNLGAKYGNGQGIAQDPKESLKWFRLAAAQGYGRGFYNIAAAFINGEVVPRDYVIAAMYFDLAAGVLSADDAAKAVANRDRILANLTPAQVQQEHDMAQKCRASQFKQCEGLADTGAADRAPSAGAPLQAGMPGTMSTGSAFFINGDGYLVTAAHVVSTCKTVQSPKAGILQRVAVDSQTDLAVLKAADKSPIFGRLKDGAAGRPGDPVVTVGFPYSSALRSGATVTTGVIAALTGLHDDSRFMQITAPVQHGNSGGPLLGPGGTVIGVVDAALIPNELTKMTSDIPQNINFATSVGTLREFLDAHRITYEAAPGDGPKGAADVAEGGMKYTIAVECTE
ncbi:MAG: trypsin-like serine protease [Rhodospirillaceae bacterium]|nr:MAG: trypsin-like serine protease [Rhodospirillaceae bacterium]